MHHTGELAHRGQNKALDPLELVTCGCEPPSLCWHPNHAFCERAASAEPSISPAPALSAGFLDSSSVRPDGGAVGLRHEASRNPGRMCSDSLAGQELARDIECSAALAAGVACAKARGQGDSLTSSPNQRASFRKALFLILGCCKSESPPIQRAARSSSP